jgi:hypothetical protein
MYIQIRGRLILLRCPRPCVLKRWLRSLFDGQGFGVGASDFMDEDGIMIGVSYIENVLEKMQGITL